MPAVMIRQLDALAKIVAYTTTDESSATRSPTQAEMILRACDESVPEPNDRADVRRSYDAVVAPFPADSGAGVDVRHDGR